MSVGSVLSEEPNMLDFCDPEIVESLKFHLRDHTMSFRFGEEVAQVEAGDHGTITTLASGKRIAAEVVITPPLGRATPSGRISIVPDSRPRVDDCRLMITTAPPPNTSTPLVT